MAARYQDFTVTAGDDRLIEITITDAAGNGVNLTGAEIRWRAFDGTAPVVSKSVGQGIVISDAIAGALQVSLDAADTRGLKGQYPHRLEVTDGSGRTATVTAGTMTVEQDLLV